MGCIFKGLQLDSRLACYLLLRVGMSKLACLLLALSFTACSTAEDFSPNDEKSDTLAECGNVDYEYLSDDDDEHMTQKRIDSLNTYAQKKLASKQCEVDTILKQRGELVADRPLISDLYRVEVGSVDHCMSGEVLYNLDWDRRYELMKSQVDKTTEFLARLHEDAGGVPTVLFDRITICPRDFFFGEGMTLDGQTLYINPDFRITGGIDVMDAKEIRSDFWTPGELLNKMPGGDKIKMLWPLLDPAGTVRSAMRHGVAERIGELVKKLKESLASDESETQSFIGAATLVSAIKKHVSGQDGPNGEESLQSRALVFVASAAEKQLICLTKEWMDYVDRPSAWTTTAEAGVASLHKEATRNALDVKVRQVGALVIGNTHFINVNLDVFFGSGYKDFESYVEVRTLEQKIDWIQAGLVVVYTIDNIEVGVDINVNKTLQSKGLTEAALECGIDL